MSNFKFRRRHFHDSPKAGVIHCGSSYELKAAIILDDDNSVKTYKSQVGFISLEGKRRFIDFMVYYLNGDVKIIEVKPKRRIDEFKEQIQDNIDFAIDNEIDFTIWSESHLGFTGDHDGQKWADEYLSKLENVDYPAIRRQRATARVKKHYESKIQTDTVTVFCEFCKENHTIMRLSFDQNVEKNGRYICIKENGQLVGRRAKDHLKKENPYAAEGKKKCLGECGLVLDFDQFGGDKSRSDGKADRCKKCRSIKAKAKYNS